MDSGSFIVPPVSHKRRQHPSPAYSPDAPEWNVTVKKRGIEHNSSMLVHAVRDPTTFDLADVTGIASQALSGIDDWDLQAGDIWSNLPDDDLFPSQPKPPAKPTVSSRKSTPSNAHHRAATAAPAPLPVSVELAVRHQPPVSSAMPSASVISHDSIAAPVTVHRHTHATTVSAGSYGSHASASRASYSTPVTATATRLRAVGTSPMHSSHSTTSGGSAPMANPHLPPGMMKAKRSTARSAVAGIKHLGGWGALQWTEDEDRQLRAAIDRYGEDWGKVAAMVPRRTAQQCLSRWTKALGEGEGKGPWTEMEDEFIRQAVREQGAEMVKWAEVASKLSGRIGKQCRERWFNHLDPSIRRDPFTPEEDRFIFEMQQKIGHKWRDIASLLPGRTENAVKNRWNSAARRRWFVDNGIPLEPRDKELHERSSGNSSKQALASVVPFCAGLKYDVASSTFYSESGIVTAPVFPVVDVRRGKPDRGWRSSDSHSDLETDTSVGHVPPRLPIVSSAPKCFVTDPRITPDADLSGSGSPSSKDNKPPSPLTMQSITALTSTVHGMTLSTDPTVAVMAHHHQMPISSEAFRLEPVSGNVTTALHCPQYIASGVDLPSTVDEHFTSLPGSMAPSPTPNHPANEHFAPPSPPEQTDTGHKFVGATTHTAYGSPLLHGIHAPAPLADNMHASLGAGSTDSSNKQDAPNFLQHFTDLHDALNAAGAAIPMDVRLKALSLINQHAPVLLTAEDTSLLAKTATTSGSNSAKTTAPATASVKSTTAGASVSSSASAKTRGAGASLHPLNRGVTMDDSLFSNSNVSTHRTRHHGVTSAANAVDSSAHPYQELPGVMDGETTPMLPLPLPTMLSHAPNSNSSGNNAHNHFIAPAYMDMLKSHADHHHHHHHQPAAVLPWTPDADFHIPRLVTTADGDDLAFGRDSGSDTAGHAKDFGVTTPGDGPSLLTNHVSSIAQAAAVHSGSHQQQQHQQYQQHQQPQHSSHSHSNMMMDYWRVPGIDAHKAMKTPERTPAAAAVTAAGLLVHSPLSNGLLTANLSNTPPLPGWVLADAMCPSPVSHALGSPSTYFQPDVEAT